MRRQNRATCHKSSEEERKCELNKVRSVLPLWVNANHIVEGADHLGQVDRGRLSLECPEAQTIMEKNDATTTEIMPNSIDVNIMGVR